MSHNWIDSLTCLSMSAIAGVPATIRESVALSPRVKESALKEWIQNARLSENRASLFYLATCHRVELYGFGIDTKQLISSWKSFAGNGVLSFKIIRGKDCLRHWIRVCSSLESEVLGETQITGQMKESFEEARKLGFLNGPLDRFAQRVLSSSKHIRASLPMGEGTVSVAHVAVDGLQDFFDDLAPKSALVIGAGSMAKQSIHRLRQRGVGHITWTNRSAGKIIQSGLLGEKIKQAPFESIHDLIWKHSITVAATSSHHRIVEEMKLLKAKPVDSGNAPRVLLDLGLPRNVEQEIHGKHGFYVRDVDEFSNIADQNSEKRRKYMDLASTLVEQELVKIIESTRNWSQVPLIKELIEVVNQRKAADNERLKLENSGKIEYITGNIYSSLLHGILKEAERMDEESSKTFLENVVRAWRHSGKWQQNQKAAQKRKAPLKNL